MDTNLTNKTALVTGSTGKLSRVICLQLAMAGADLALHYRHNHDQAEELRRQVDKMGRRARVYACDLTEPREPERLAERVLHDFGRIDVLVNAASVFAFKRLGQTDDHLWQTMMDLHVTAVFRLVRALEANFRSHTGAIVNIADVWGLQPKASFLAYSVSKGALIALTKALADELAPTTTVNAIAPGIAHFPPDFPDQMREEVIRRIPMQRLAQPEAVADLILEIATNRYITGQIIAIDGGRSLI